MKYNISPSDSAAIQPNTLSAFIGYAISGQMRSLPFSDYLHKEGFNLGLTAGILSPARIGPLRLSPHQIKQRSFSRLGGRSSFHVLVVLSG
jgi:hypothetical protein